MDYNVCFKSCHDTNCVMSVSSVDQMRRMLLGPLYHKCGTEIVSKDELKHQYQVLKQSGLLPRDFNLDKLVKMCDLKQISIQSSSSSIDSVLSYKPKPRQRQDIDLISVESKRPVHFDIDEDEVMVYDSRSSILSKQYRRNKRVIDDDVLSVASSSSKKSSIQQPLFSDSDVYLTSISQDPQLRQLYAANPKYLEAPEEVNKPVVRRKVKPAPQKSLTPPTSKNPYEALGDVDWHSEADLLTSDSEQSLSEVESSFFDNEVPDNHFLTEKEQFQDWVKSKLNELQLQSGINNMPGIIALVVKAQEMPINRQMLINLLQETKKENGRPMDPYPPRKFVLKDYSSHEDFIHDVDFGDPYTDQKVTRQNARPLIHSLDNKIFEVLLRTSSPDTFEIFRDLMNYYISVKPDPFLGWNSDPIEMIASLLNYIPATQWMDFVNYFLLKDPATSEEQKVRLRTLITEFINKNEKKDEPYDEQDELQYIFQNAMEIHNRVSTPEDYEAEHHFFEQLFDVYQPTEEDVLLTIDLYDSDTGDRMPDVELVDMMKHKGINITEKHLQQANQVGHLPMIQYIRKQLGLPKLDEPQKKNKVKNK